MGDIYGAIQDLEELLQYLENELPVYAEKVAANDLAALVTNRVVQKGENFKGGRFKPYSTKQIAAWRFWGKSRTQAAEKKVRTRSRARGAFSYSEFRKLNNLNTDKKNFEFTGEMWRKFGIVSKRMGKGTFKIQLGGTTEAAQNKIDSNSEREGMSIIEASENEQKLAAKAAQGWLEKHINRILNT